MNTFNVEAALYFNDQYYTSSVFIYVNLMKPTKLQKPRNFPD